ncbi:MAG: ribonuclease P protein component [Deltaproteobacteria bacterium]|nr:MAG: ribonuclease P protein component [Deltaproteobacteria bacterium]
MPIDARQRLPRSARLRRRREFVEVQRYGRSVRTRVLVLLVATNELGRRRLGVTVSRRVSRRAVDRNRIKRRLREIFRRERGVLPDGVDVVLVARPAALDASYETLRSAFLEAARRLPDLGKGSGEGGAR